MVRSFALLRLLGWPCNSRVPLALLLPNYHSPTANRTLYYPTLSPFWHWFLIHDVRRKPGYELMHPFEQHFSILSKSGIPFADHGCQRPSCKCDVMYMYNVHAYKTAIVAGAVMWRDVFILVYIMYLLVSFLRRRLCNFTAVFGLLVSVSVSISLAVSFCRYDLAHSPSPAIFAFSVLIWSVIPYSNH